MHENESVELTARQVFLIAEQIERNGAKFYRKAAGMFRDPTTARMFDQLAGWESRHEAIFAEMRLSLEEKEAAESPDQPESGLLPHSRVLAGLAVFGIQADPQVELTGHEDRGTVLHWALQKERDSVIFYSGLKEFVKDAPGVRRVDEIISEEMRHIRIIAQAMEQARQD